MDLQLVRDEDDLLDIRGMHIRGMHIDRALDDKCEVDRRPVIAERPPFAHPRSGSVSMNTAATPRRLYSKAQRAGWPGAIGSGVRVSASNCTLVLSRRTNAAVGRRLPAASRRVQVCFPWQQEENL